MAHEQKRFLLPALILAWACSVPALASDVKNNDGSARDKSPAAAASKNARLDPIVKPQLDRTGQPRNGKASYYGKEFYGRKMADGTPFNPDSNVAASRTLPLGTIAEVTNLENGKSEIVEIRDRGPYIEGRIVDLSPSTAEKLDMKDQGVAPVVVKPIEVPQRDGSVKPGAGASEDVASAGER